MAVITINLISRGPYFISGIPREVEVETNIPSTVFYTLDGTEPTFASRVYLEPIELPTDVSVRLRLLAVSGADRGTLDVLFSTDSLLYYPRRSSAIGALGIAVDAYDVDPVLVDGYGTDAYGDIIVPVRRSDYELQDLEIKYSRTGPDGYGPGTMIVMGIPPLSFWQDDAVSEQTSTPNNQNVYFNPRSLYVVMDGRDGYEDQSTYPINRPWGTTSNMVKFLQGRSFYQPNPYVSGGIVRSFFNYDTGTAVTYYFDSNELRWIKSIQSFDPSTVPTRIGDRRQTGPPLVFKWIYNKRSML
jgi:hypothetical protein